jgi:hypothetical protein
MEIGAQLIIKKKDKTAKNGNHQLLTVQIPSAHVQAGMAQNYVLKPPLKQLKTTTMSVISAGKNSVPASAPNLLINQLRQHLQSYLVQGPRKGLFVKSGGIPGLCCMKFVQCDPSREPTGAAWLFIPLAIFWV